MKWRLSQKLEGYKSYQQSGPIEGFALDCPKIDVDITHFIYFQEKGNGFFYFIPEEYHKEGKKFFSRFLEDQNIVADSLAKIFKYSDELREAVGDFNKIDFSKKIDQELFGYYQKFAEAHEKLWRIAMIPNILEFENSYLTDYLNTYLEKQGSSKKNLPKDFALFIFDERESEQKKRDTELLKLISYLKKDKDKIKDNKKIIRFYEKYSYLSYNWSGPAQGKEELLKEILDLIAIKVDFNKQCLEEKKETKEKISEKKKLIKDLKIDKFHQGLSDILIDIIYTKAYRMEAAYFTYFQMEYLFREIAKRLNLSLNQIQTIPAIEMKRFLVDKKFTLEEANDMVKLCLFYFDDKKIKHCTGKKARVKIDKVLDNLEEEIEGGDLEGKTAYPGKAKGIVKLIITKDDLDKMEEGNILVSPYTDPTLMPAIKKAGAIVTDVGGMTCHAAIVSRELKKPCVIGTKTATKSLKDGDMVEVDANKGIIKIIK